MACLRSCIPTRGASKAWCAALWISGMRDDHAVISSSLAGEGWGINVSSIINGLFGFGFDFCKLSKLCVITPCTFYD